MATAQLDKVKEFLTCTVCADTYTDPCTLMCQHSFCRNCITMYTKTKPEALRTKTISCPSCRQVTKVPDPTKPVEQWAAQIKPSIIILGLIDTTQSDPSTKVISEVTTTTGAITKTKRTGRKCNICEHLEESTEATSWCSECEITLCDRCAKAHLINPASQDHEICDLSAEVKVRERHKVMCEKHKMSHIKFHCGDCKKSACQICRILHHRRCKYVVTIDSMKPQMMSDLHKKKEIIRKRFERSSKKLRENKAAMTEVSQKKRNIISQIQSVNKNAIDNIEQKEKELMDQLDQVTETQMSQLQGDVKSDEIEIQKCTQHCEFIDQALNSDSVMDVYDVYQACESGVLDLGDDREAKDTQKIANFRFIQELRTICSKLDELKLGINIIDVRTQEDKDTPDLYDVTVVGNNSEKTIIVTDWNDKCVKSFYIRNRQSCYSIFPVKSYPWGISKFNANQIVVTVPDALQIVRISVTPDLIQLSTIKTSKSYYSVAVPNAQSLAAGCFESTAPSVDFLNMSGQVMKSVATHNNETLFHSPTFMCANNKGYIFVSDRGTHTVTCLTPDGDVLWQYAPTGDIHLQFLRGITTDNEGHIFLADRVANKVIQLTEEGEFVKEVLTVKDGVSKPYGLTCHKPGTLLVCTGSSLKEFTLS